MSNKFPFMIQKIAQLNRNTSLSALLSIALGTALAVTPLDAARGQTPSAQAQPSETAKPDDEQNIRFSADAVSYDDDNDSVIAQGNVILRRNGQTLRADRVLWLRRTGEIRAEGQVVMMDPHGNRFFGDNVVLDEDIRDGMVENLLVVLKEGGRMAAHQGSRSGNVYTLNGAVYSPYPVENEDGSPRTPTWLIRAVTVMYDPVEDRVRYEGAQLQLFGISLIPLPGLAHSVSDKARSGLLVPNIRITQANGIEYEQPYYFALAPNRDLTVTGSVFSDVLPLVQARYRALTDDGAYEVAGYITASTPIPVGLIEAPPGANTELRGYFDASGKFQLDPNWSVSGSIRVASDRTFLRRYNVSRDDRLRSTIQAERIDDNSYFALIGWATQTLRVNDPQGQVPIALPVIDYRHRFDNPLGANGKLEIQLNSLAIGRTEGQDTQRAFAGVRWQTSRLARGGQILTFTAEGRGDIYNTDETALTTTLIYQGNEGFEARALGSLAADLQWPLVGEAFGGTQTITPRVQLVATTPTPNLAIPNEDSRAIELESSNIFALNRLPGYDRVEDGFRVVYGAAWELRRPGMHINAMIGQSYRLTDKQAFIPVGTGLAERTSDVVGRTDVRFRDFVQFTHRYRLDKDNLAVRRNEIDAIVGSRRTYGQIGYLRLNRDIGPEIEDLQDREELRMAGRLQIDRYWSVFGSSVFDLTNADEDPTSFSDGFEPIRTRLGISYDDEGVSLGFTWRRDFVATGDAARGNSFLFNIAFRNLGI